MTAQVLAERIQSFGHKETRYVGGLDEAVEALLSVIRPGDLVLTLGAGNVYQVGEKLLVQLGGH